MVAWPSGLRRWFKAPVSSEAWVRIPSLPQFFFFNLNNYFTNDYELFYIDSCSVHCKKTKSFLSTEYTPGSATEWYVSSIRLLKYLNRFVLGTMDELPIEQSCSQSVNPSHVTINGLTHYCTHNASVNNSI